MQLGFTLVRVVKGDVCLKFYAPRINEDVIAIVSIDGTIKTILTLQSFSIMPDTRKYKSIEKGLRLTRAVMLDCRIAK